VPESSALHAFKESGECLRGKARAKIEKGCEIAFLNKEVFED
jgi:hypothetical protein